MFEPFLDRQFYAAREGSRHSNLIHRANRPYEYIQSWPNTSLTFILNIFGGPTSGGYNLRTVTPIFYYNPISEMATRDLQVQIRASAHLSHFRASSGHQKPFKIEHEFFVPKNYTKNLQ